MAGDVANLAEHRAKTPTGETELSLLRAALLEQGKAIGDVHLAIDRLDAKLEARFDEIRELLQRLL